MKMCELSTAINKYSFNIKYYFQNQILNHYRYASQSPKFPLNVSKISASFNIQASGFQTSMTKYEWRSNNYSPAQYKNTDRHIQIYSLWKLWSTHTTHTYKAIAWKYRGKTNYINRVRINDSRIKHIKRYLFLFFSHSIAFVVVTYLNDNRFHLILWIKCEAPHTSRERKEAQQRSIWFFMSVSLYQNTCRAAPVKWNTKQNSTIPTECKLDETLCKFFSAFSLRAAIQ